MNVTDIKPGNFLVFRSGSTASVIRREGTEVYFRYSASGENTMIYYGDKTNPGTRCWPEPEAPIAYLSGEVNYRRKGAFDMDIIGVFKSSSPNSTGWKADIEKYPYPEIVTPRYFFDFETYSPGDWATAVGAGVATAPLVINGSYYGTYTTER